MNGWIVGIVIFFGILAIIGFSLYNNYLSNRIKKQVARPNMPLIEIQSQLRKSIIGYSRGIVDLQIPKPNGTYYFKIFPDDVLQGEDVERPEAKELIVHKDYIKRNAEGSPSPKRQTITILPFSKDDLPEEVRNTLNGEYLEIEGQKAFVKQVVGSAKINERKAIVEAMKEFAFGEISKTDQRRLKDLKEKEIKMIEEKREEPKKNE